MLPKLHPVSVGLAACLATLVACSGSDLADARAVVEQFCAAVAAGNVDGARACLTAADRQSGAGRLDQRGLQNGYEVGPARLEGEHARVNVQVKDAPAPVTFVLRREASTWRIDLHGSMEATLGSKFEQVRKVLDQTGKQMVERLDQARRGTQAPLAPPTPR